jgi:hypothetical protein
LLGVDFRKLIQVGGSRETLFLWPGRNPASGISRLGSGTRDVLSLYPGFPTILEIWKNLFSRPEKSLEFLYFELTVVKKS